MLNTFSDILRRFFEALDLMRRIDELLGPAPANCTRVFVPWPGSEVWL